MIAALGRRGEEICRWILLVLYVGANLLFSTQTFNIVLLKDLFAPFCALLLLLVWMTGEIAATGRWRARTSALHLPLSLLFLFLAFSSATSPSPYESVEEFVRFFTNFLILLALPKFLTDRVWLARFLSAIGWVALASTLYGLSQWANADLLAAVGDLLPAGWGFPGWGQGVFISTHGNPNFYSGYLVATIPILLGLWASTRSPALLLGLPALLAAMILSVVKAEARGAYLGLGAALAIFAGVAYLRRQGGGAPADPDVRSLRRTGVGFVLGCALLVALLRPDLARRPFDTVRENAVSLLDPESSYTNAVRLILWQTWLDGWEREPWFGRGLGVSNVRMPVTRPNWYHHGGVAHNSDHAHNEWFEWMMEGGVAGTTLYVWLHLVLFGVWLRTLRARWRDADLPILLGAGLGLVSQLLQSCFDPETRWTGNAVTNHFCAGLMIAWSNLPAPSDERPRVAWDGAEPPDEAPRRRRAAFVLAAAAAAMLFFFVGSIRVWRADHHYRNSTGLTGGRVTARHLAAAGMEGATAAIYNPYHLTNLYSLSLVRMTHGDAAGALRVLRHLQALAPDYVQIHQLLASAKDEIGARTAAAWERDRVAIFENSVDNHLAAAQAWAQLGRTERAIPHLHHALAIDRDDEEGSRSVLFYKHDVVRGALAVIEP